MKLVPAQYGGFILNLIICFEMVIIALAHLYAFPWTDYIDERDDRASRFKKSLTFCENIFRILFASRDVIDDVQNTFVNDYKDQQDETLQLDSIRKTAFNWSDEELLAGDLDPEDFEAKMYKDKYGKKKQSKMQKAMIYTQNVTSKLKKGAHEIENKYMKMSPNSKESKRGSYMGTQLQNLSHSQDDSTDKLIKPNDEDIDALISTPMGHESSGNQNSNNMEEQ